jgi:two-component system chemotaxis response regulator CheB
MRALPPLGPERAFTGLVCPDCGGNLVVTLLGGSHLHFACRVGHTFSLVELLDAKEQRLESALWTAVFCGEELAALLDDTLARPGVAPEMADGFARRRDLAGQLARQLRELIARDRPLASVDPVSQVEPGVSP